MSKEKVSEQIQKSIVKWEGIVDFKAIDKGTDNCYLCECYDDYCNGCPIAKDKVQGCDFNEYTIFSKHNQNLNDYIDKIIGIDNDGSDDEFLVYLNFLAKLYENSDLNGDTHLKIFKYIDSAKKMLDYLKELKKKYEDIENPQEKHYYINDGSFALYNNPDRLTRESYKNTGMYKNTRNDSRKYKIIATNCVLPSSDYVHDVFKDDEREVNNTIIQDITDDTIVFIQARMLKLCK